MTLIYARKSQDWVIIASDKRISSDNSYTDDYNKLIRKWEYVIWCSGDLVISTIVKSIKYEIDINKIDTLYNLAKLIRKECEELKLQDKDLCWRIIVTSNKKIAVIDDQCSVEYKDIAIIWSWEDYALYMIENGYTSREIFKYVSSKNTTVSKTYNEIIL